MADSRLKALGFVPHKLDPCLYLPYNPDFPNQPDDCISLHVDDMLGARSEVEYTHSNNFAARISQQELSNCYRLFYSELGSKNRIWISVEGI